MKKHKLIIGLTLALVSLTAYAQSAIPVSGEVVTSSENENVRFPDRSHSYKRKGIGGDFVNVENLRNVRKGMSKEGVRRLLGNPHFNEGIAGARHWNYIFNFATGPEEHLSCQYQIEFERQENVGIVAKGIYWNTDSCLNFLNAGSHSYVAQSAPAQPFYKNETNDELDARVRYLEGAVRSNTQAIQHIPSHLPSIGADLQPLNSMTEQLKKKQADQEQRLAFLEAELKRNNLQPSKTTPAFHDNALVSIQGTLQDVKNAQQEQNRRLIELEKMKTSVKAVSYKIDSLEKDFQNLQQQPRGDNSQLQGVTAEIQRRQAEQDRKISILAQSIEEQRQQSAAQLAQFSEMLKNQQNSEPQIRMARGSAQPSNTPQQNASESQSGKFVLSNDTLFRFKGYSRSDILGDGEARLRGLAEALISSGARIDVVGHEDKIEGKEVAKVGQKRADVIRKLLIEAGVPAENVQAYSAGSQEPASSKCGNNPKDGAIACLQPNRRVAIHVR